MSNWHWALKPGDVVTVRLDDGRLSDYEVKYAPWTLDNGHALIGLKGIAGGYSLDRVVSVANHAAEVAGG